MQGRAGEMWSGCWCLVFKANSLKQIIHILALPSNGRVTKWQCRKYPNNEWCEESWSHQKRITMSSYLWYYTSGCNASHYTSQVSRYCIDAYFSRVPIETSGDLAFTWRLCVCGCNETMMTLIWCCEHHDINESYVLTDSLPECHQLVEVKC